MVWGQLLVGALAGMAAGTILAFLSHLAPRFGAGNFIQSKDIPKLFGKPISRREAYLVGLFAHLSLSAFFGLAFAVFVELGWLPGYQYVPMLLFVIGLTLVVGFIIMPLEGDGIFGRKRDSWFMIDALVTNMILGHLFLLLMRLWMVR
ncbi:MAG: hypothetical protein NUW08_02860 [Candidatus Uhrbacteria bacterium]|nr:hypothetical protein [Candidatus Uhrbacteria bacterium]